MRILFKNQQEEGFLNTMMSLISVPLTIIRDYTVPIGEEDAWDRQRASILPIFIVMAFLWLNGDFKDIETDDKA